jgi:hypothetical protein
MGSSSGAPARIRTLLGLVAVTRTSCPAYLQSHAEQARDRVTVTVTVAAYSISAALPTHSNVLHQRHRLRAQRRVAAAAPAAADHDRAVPHEDHHVVALGDVEVEGLAHLLVCVGRRPVSVCWKG